RPKATGIPMTIAALFILAVPCVYLNNRYDDAHYLYLKHGNFAMLDFLPDSIFLTGLVLVIAVLILLSLDWLVYRLATRKSRAKAEEIRKTSSPA
ncbi:MAG: hypothetical protein J5599_04255, partial [Spirochaetales bacterium]|nr:hypothetical protein [Spirochaetales bacterium]